MTIREGCVVHRTDGHDHHDADVLLKDNGYVRVTVNDRWHYYPPDRIDYIEYDPNGGD